MRITIEIDGNGAVRVAPGTDGAGDASSGGAVGNGGVARSGAPAGDDWRMAGPAREVPGPSRELVARIEAAIGAAGPGADAGQPRR
ncbi:MAG: hypothetical protein AB7F99_05180 [Vicinamibacterales bacterium]